MNLERSTQSTKSSHTCDLLASGILQRKCACGQQKPGGGLCTACESKYLNLQRRPVSHTDRSEVPPIVHDVLRSPGQSLDTAISQFMEPRFGYDFSSVRIHTDAQASESTRSVNALAYTVGNHLVFRSGQYDTQSRPGRNLLAHELTHVVQQSRHQGVMKRALEIGSENNQAEIEADRIADYVSTVQPLLSVPPIQSSPIGSIALQRQPTTPQRRGGQARLATIERAPRGEDQVRIRVFRYLCDCQGRNVSRSSFSARLQPRPGITYQFCRGRTTVRILGEVVPSSITSGTATARVDVNIAPEQGGTGGRVQVEGEARNTGSEPQVGGRVAGTIETPSGSPNVTASGEIFVGTETGQIDTRVGGGVRVGDTTISIDSTNPQDDRRAITFGVGGTFGGPPVQREVCRECNCPIVYDCLEDILSRSFEEQVPITINERSRFRYYFRLNTSRDARSSRLRAESTRSIDHLVQAVNNGAEILSIKGFASPEAGEATRNQELSVLRGERLREIIVQRLGQGVSIPASEPGGELLGSRPTITPGSGLSDAILDTGFGDAEDVSSFLFGDEIENNQLADHFLELLDRVPEPEDRLRLFGIAEDSPVSVQLLAAIEQFIALGGHGSRPWERVFEFLRFATVEVNETRQEMHTEQRQTRGSLRTLGQALCNRFGQQAEDENMFGQTESEPTQSDCPVRDPVNREEYAGKCNYG